MAGPPVICHSSIELNIGVIRSDQDRRGENAGENPYLVMVCRNKYVMHVLWALTKYMPYASSRCHIHMPTPQRPVQWAVSRTELYHLFWRCNRRNGVPVASTPQPTRRIEFLDDIDLNDCEVNSITSGICDTVDSSPSPYTQQLNSIAFSEYFESVGI